MTLILSGIGIGFALAVTLLKGLDKSEVGYQKSAYELLMGAPSNA